ncbi:MAG: class I SAM-dependent methyltransferase, partial [Methyloligellaceae bacterium]
WRKQMAAFIRLSDQFMEFGPEDKVLDFGCGSGHFAEMMHTRVGSIVCADMSEHYVEVCRQKFSSIRNVSVVRVSPDMADLNQVGGGFSRAICLSVLHYFSELQHVEAFVTGMQQLCRPAAKLLIADIGNERRTWRDMAKTVRFALREGMLLDVAAMTLKMWLVDPGYRRVKAGGRSYLHIPDGYFARLGARLGIRITRLETQFTINANYGNVLVEF